MGVKTLRNKNKGFTLIELLVVIAIIGLLASVVLLSLNSARAKSRDAKRLADVRQIASALELYFNDFSGYPAATSNTPAALAPNYIGALPTSPTPPDNTCTATGSGSNAYYYTASGTSFTSPKDNATTVYPTYSLTFCLGANTGGYTDGADANTNVDCTLSPAGITCS